MLNVHRSFVLAWDIWLWPDQKSPSKDWLRRWSSSGQNPEGWLRISAEGHFLGWHPLTSSESELTSDFWKPKVKKCWLHYDPNHGYGGWRAFIELSNQGLIALLGLREPDAFDHRLDELCAEVFPAVDSEHHASASSSADGPPRFASLIYVQPDWGDEKSQDLEAAVRAIDFDFGLSQSHYQPRIIGDVLLAGALGEQSTAEALTAFYLPHAIQKETGPLAGAAYLKASDIALPAVVEDTWRYLRYSVITRDLCRRTDLLPLRSSSISQQLAAIADAPLEKYELRFLPERARECTERSQIGDSLRSIQHATEGNLLHQVARNQDTKWYTWPLTFQPPQDQQVSYLGVLDVLESIVSSVDRTCALIEAGIKDSESRERLLADFYRDSTTIAVTKANLSLQKVIRLLTAVAAFAALAQLAALFL